MDHREILTRYKAGTLDRRHAITLLRGGSPAGPGRPPVPHPTAPPAAGGHLPAVAEGCAVIGIAGRYPHAPDLGAFWLEVLKARETVSAPPARRAGAGGGARGRFIERADEFDPEFFGLPGTEAALMDPQERLFLEVAWETLESAGYTGVRLDALAAADGERRSVGVYAAICSADYALLAAQAQAQAQVQADGCPAPLVDGGHWRVPNRLSVLLDLRGPSHSVDTAQSSFLTAVHQALGALRTGECAAALVGAVDLRLHPSRHTPGGGEAVGAILLKPLARARADGDTVHAVIRSSAVVHQGSNDPQATEERLARAARTTAGIGAADITLRESAHSVSRGVGDAGAATAVAALTRTVLQLRHATLAPDGPGARARPWTPRTADGTPLRRTASVTVRGAGGVCAQLVVEEYPHPHRPATAAPARPSPPGGQEELVLLSAPTRQHLVATARRFAVWAAALHDADGAIPAPADLARELRTGRAAMDCRLAVTVRDTAQLAAALRAFGRDPEARHTAVSSADLRARTAVPPLDAELPETRDYLTALWRARRHEQLTRLWLSGVDVNAVARPRTPVVPLPTTALIRRPLWFDRGEHTR
ncbi:beta-ketoacyl synthase N-terminal-like domain-containing protein [Streptomyces sp. NPDC048275]|uniref:beta-ketoacyl synthase N-terminal-like domain-containing protein n=1 Tax=Streptomyces sp. NPDC048275 TaxID=3155629 RepID=UPI0033CAB950